MDFITGGGVIAFAIFVLAYSASFPAAKGTDLGPSLFPRVIASILLLLGALVLYRAARVRSGAQVQSGEAEVDSVITTAAGMRNVLVTIVAVVAYILVVDALGFIPTTIVFLFVLMKTYGLTMLKSILFSCLITGFVYVLFAMLLRVVLP
jgi:putative tricarboxylic transport membrane protein